MASGWKCQANYTSSSSHLKFLNFENARPRSGFPRSRLELGHWEKGYLSVVESGDRRGRIKAGGICAILGAISASGYVRTRCTERPRYWGNIVEAFLDRFCTLGMARFYLYVVWQDRVLLCLASPKSEQLGVPTVPGRRGAIGLRLGYILGHTERCSMLFLWADSTLSSRRKSWWKIGALEHYFW